LPDSAMHPGGPAAARRIRDPDRLPAVGRWLCAALLLCLCGCGGGGSSSGDSASAASEQFSVSGVVHKGPVQDASVSAYRVDGNGRGSLLGSATTAEDGGFSIDYQDYSGPVWLEAINGSYRDEASGSNTPLTTPLRAVVASTDDPVTLSPLTDIAVRLMDSFTVGEISRVNADVSALFFTGDSGTATVSITGTRPLDLQDGDVVTGTGATAEAVDYGLVLAGLSHYMVSNGVDLEGLLTLLASDAADLRLDQTVDGLQAGIDSFLLGDTNAGVPIDHRLGSLGADLLLGSGLEDTRAPAGHSIVTDTGIVGSLTRNRLGLTIVNGELFAGYRISLDDSSPATAAIILEGRVVDSQQALDEVDLGGLAEGTITISLVLTDNAGNSAAPVVRTVIRDLGVYRISGNISLAPGTQVDSDVNTVTETGDFNVTNNSFTDAQRIFSPGLLGGYVNRRLTGPAGRLRNSGDEDFFEVVFAGGEQVLLSIADAAADLDLELYDSGASLVADSLGTTDTEVVRVASAGTYYIRVFPFSGASNYVLSIGLPVSPAANSSPASLGPARLSSFDLFEDEAVIVKMDPQQPDGMVTGLLDDLDRMGVRPRRTGIPEGRPGKGAGDGDRHAMLMTLDSPDGRRQLMQRAGAEELSLPAGISDRPRFRRQQTLRAIKALRRLPGIEYAEPNYRRSPQLVPNDSYFSFQWSLPHVGVPEAWDITTGAPEVIVAVVDTGILPNHPDLAGQLVPGYDMISDSARAGDGDGLDPDPTDPGNDDPNSRSTFHGSHIAGILAAASNNGEGIAGIAWRSRIMPIRALGDDGGSSYDLMQGLLYAAGLPNDSGTVPPVTADIINLSIADPSSSRFEQDIIDQVRGRGLILVAAAGNQSSSEPSYPAAYNGVVSVSAVNQGNLLAGYSNFGSTVDVAAPGGDLSQDSNNDGEPDGVLSTIADDSGDTLRYGYAYFDGTSMATPVVAGVAALMKAVRPGLTPGEFDMLLVQGRLTDDLGLPGRDDSFGNGLINAYKAVSSALDLENDTSTPLPPRLDISPAVLDFGATLSSMSFSLSNGGDGELAIIGLEVSAGWLTLDPVDLTAGGQGTYQLQANRNGLAPGLYQAQVIVDSSAGNGQLSVRLQVSDTEVTVDAGTHFIILVNAATGDILQSRELRAGNGQYPFSLDGLAAGEYLVRAGTDHDNNLLICDGGEACGAYPALNSVQPLRVDRNRQITFSSGFEQGRFQSQQAGEADDESGISSGQAVAR